MTWDDDGGWTWAAWMRGSSRMDMGGLLGLCPEIGRAARHLADDDVEGYASEASSAVGGPDDWEERAFVAYRVALQWMADRAAAGRGYRGGMARIVGRVYGDEVTGMMLYRALRDLPGILRPTSPQSLDAARGAFLGLYLECLGSVTADRDKVSASEAAADALDSLVSSCAGLEGAGAILERTSLQSIFLRLLARTLSCGGSDGSRVDAGAVGSALSKVPGGWGDGSYRTVRELLGALCSCQPAPLTGADIDAAYVDMSGFPAPFGSQR